MKRAVLSPRFLQDALSNLGDESDLVLPDLVSRYLDRLTHTFREIVADILSIHDPVEWRSLATRLQAMITQTETAFLDPAFVARTAEFSSLLAQAEEAANPEAITEKLVSNFRTMLQRILIVLNDNQEQVKFMFFSPIGIT